MPKCEGRSPKFELADSWCWIDSSRILGNLEKDPWQSLGWTIGSSFQTNRTGLRHSGQAQREPESSSLWRQRLGFRRRDLDSRPGLPSAGVTFFRGNDETLASNFAFRASKMNLLSPIAALYGAVVRLRGWGYAAGVFRVARLQSPVISVGNLTMGGTGKTPTTIALGKRLLDSGHRVAILSRGYKGEHSGGPLLVSDGQCIHTTAKEAGDEALVIARNLPRALVAVARKRAQAGAWLEKHFGVDVHLLDDGFQHLQLHRDLNLLVVDATNPFGGGLPPRGRLREPLDAIRRADAVFSPEPKRVMATMN